MWTNDSVRDADYYYSDRADPRPVFSRCIYCGKIIYSSAPGWDGDEYVDTPDGSVHWDCWGDYGRKIRREAM